MTLMSERGRVLVTGASGFVGSAIVRAFLSSGYPVRALVRSTSPRQNLQGLAIECVEGDICDPDAMGRAMSGIRYLAHAAADYRLWARDPAAIMRTNVEGTRTVMKAARTAGVERIVYTSSVATLALRPAGEVADESIGLAENEALGAYKRSKVTAERLIDRWVAQDRLPVVIVNPSTPIGPRDIRPTPTGRIIIEAAAGRMPGFVDTGLNLVHVDDVGSGHVAALERGTPGERYILGGDNVTLAQMLSDIALLVGGRPPRLKLPRAPLYPLAIAAQIIARAIDREPLLTLDGLRMSRHRMFFTSEKAGRELGFRGRPYKSALQDAVEWFLANGYLQ
jgi:dihydroflavonol-4-reductase